MMLFFLLLFSCVEEVRVIFYHYSAPLEVCVLTERDCSRREGEGKRWALLTR